MRTSDTPNIIARLFEQENVRHKNMIAFENAHHKEVVTDLENMDLYVKGGNLDGNRVVPPSLFKIISEDNYKDDKRIPIDPNRRKELIKDFWKLNKANALSEDAIAFWISVSFRGFINPKKEIIIQPKIDLGNIRYFIRSIYSKYNDGSRNSRAKYRDILKRTHYYKEKSESIMKHFADKEPKKFPEELKIQ